MMAVFVKFKNKLARKGGWGIMFPSGACSKGEQGNSSLGYRPSGIPSIPTPILPMKKCACFSLFSPGPFRIWGNCKWLTLDEFKQSTYKWRNSFNCDLLAKGRKSVLGKRAVLAFPVLPFLLGQDPSPPSVPTPLPAPSLHTPEPHSTLNPEDFFFFFFG